MDMMTMRIRKDEKVVAMMWWACGLGDGPLEFGAKSNLNGRSVWGPGPNSGAPRVRDPGGSGFLFILGDSYLY